MKITKELDNKIKRCVEEKYGEEIKSLIKEKERIADAEIEKAVSEIKEAMVNYPSIKRYMKSRLGTYNPTVEKYIKNDCARFVDAEKYKSINENIDRIAKASAVEKENMMIAISYEKDINGIKGTFADMGFKFE